MKPETKSRITFVVVIAIAVGLIGYLAPEFLQGGVVLSSEQLLPSATVEGDILAIENVADANGPSRKEALVRLTTGETVRAYIPPACVVFAGQVAKFSRFDHKLAPKPFYVFKEAR